MSESPQIDDDETLDYDSAVHEIDGIILILNYVLECARRVDDGKSLLSHSLERAIADVIVSKDRILM